MNNVRIHLSCDVFVCILRACAARGTSTYFKPRVVLWCDYKRQFFCYALSELEY